MSTVDLGETFIRRSANAPAGTFAQRVAWADAGDPGMNVGRVMATPETGYNSTGIPEGSILLAVRRGVIRVTPEQLEHDWERP